MAGFGAMILGALIAFLSVSGKGRGVVKPGFGIWLEIIAGAVGLLFLLGIIKMPQNKPAYYSEFLTLQNDKNPVSFTGFFI
jgi:hypothetical protein